MNTHDRAAFENWLEHWATADEKNLTYEKQLEAHIMWLAGGADQFLLKNLPKEAFQEVH